MKTILKVMGVLVVLVLCASVGAMAYYAREARNGMEIYQKRVAMAWATYESQYKADAARWSQDPLFQPHPGGDAAPLFLAHMRYESEKKKPPPVPDALKEQMAIGDGGWPENSSRFEVKDIDTKWMSGLGELGYFDIEGPGTPLENAPYDPVRGDIPNFIDLVTFAKVRLTQGLQSGDARPAARETRELARLCLSSETILGEVFGVSILGHERRAHDEAVRLGQDVTGWNVFSVDEEKSLKRVLFAGPAPYSLLATDPLAKVTPSIGGCAGLNEGIVMAHFLRRFSERELPERYASLTKAIETSSCRLRRARVAWKANDTAGQLPDSGEALCQSDLYVNMKDCPYPRAIVLFPFARTLIGDMLVQVSWIDWFRWYGMKD
jgi:hypothetical protein